MSAIKTAANPVSKQVYESALKASVGSVKVDKSSSAEESLKNLVSMTPAQRMRASLLKGMDLTEDQLQNMAPKERRAVEDKISQTIKNAAEQQASRKAGFIMDFQA